MSANPDIGIINCLPMKSLIRSAPNHRGCLDELFD